MEIICATVCVITLHCLPLFRSPKKRFQKREERKMSTMISSAKVFTTRNTRNRKTKTDTAEQVEGWRFPIYFVSCVYFLRRGRRRLIKKRRKMFLNDLMGNSVYSEHKIRKLTNPRVKGNPRGLYNFPTRTENTHA